MRPVLRELPQEPHADADVGLCMEAGFLDLPVHPIVVHFPIAMLTVAWVLVVLGHATRDGEKRFLAHVSMFETIGVLAFVPTIITGFRDAGWFEVFRDTAWSRPLFWHLVTGLLTVAVFSVHTLWRRRTVILEGRAVVVDLGLASAGFWLLAMTGLLAGEVVFG
jgi:uncharacterized membrane protein